MKIMLNRASRRAVLVTELNVWHVTILYCMIKVLTSS